MICNIDNVRIGSLVKDMDYNNIYILLEINKQPSTGKDIYYFHCVDDPDLDLGLFLNEEIARWSVLSY
jgi:hypothetical protein